MYRMGNKPSNTAPVVASGMNAAPVVPSGMNATKPAQGGKRYRKRRGGVAPLSAFDAPQHQPSQKIMNWATTAGGSRRRKHKSRKHKSRRHRK